MNPMRLIISLIALVAIVASVCVFRQLSLGDPKSQKLTNDQKLPMTEDITGTYVVLKIGGTQALFAMLAADGSINRLGNGSLKNPENDMFIGMTDPSLFSNLRPEISKELLDWCGSQRTAPHIEGDVCDLTVGFMRTDGSELTSVWRYGSRSQGPPPVVASFVVALANATDPWFEDQKRTNKKR
jgi:hypothetical protein